MKILFVTTISNTVNAFLIPHIKMLIELGHQVDVAFNVEQEVNTEIIEMGCKVHELDFFRSPINIRNYHAYKKLKKLIQNEKYDAIHTHTPVASACVRLACRNFKGIKVYYTAHGFHFYKGSPIQNWIIYYPIEKVLAKYTDVLITINKEDYELANKSFEAAQVKYIHGIGININKFRYKKVDRTEKLSKIGIPEESFVILSVGELNKNKNHEIVIRALSRLENKNIHYVVLGQGALNKKLNNLAFELGIQERIHLLGYRTDVGEFYKVSDLFCFPSLREGLPVSLMEAMICGLPVICSNIRGNIDLIDDGIGGYLFNPENVNDLLRVINLFFRNDKVKVEKMRDANFVKVKEFSIEKVKKEMKSIYNIGETALIDK